MNFVLGSTSVTLMPARFRYLAQVAPPKPPPTTTTCAPILPCLPAYAASERPNMPSAEAALAPPVSFRKSLRVMRLMSAPLLETADVAGDRRDFGVGVALGVARHDRARACPRLEIVHGFHNHVGAFAVQARDRTGTLAAGPVAREAVVAHVGGGRGGNGFCLRGVGRGGLTRWQGQDAGGRQQKQKCSFSPHRFLLSSRGTNGTPRYESRRDAGRTCSLSSRGTVRCYWRSDFFKVFIVSRLCAESRININRAPTSGFYRNQFSSFKQKIGLRISLGSRL